MAATGRLAATCTGARPNPHSPIPKPLTALPQGPIMYVMLRWGSPASFRSRIARVRTPPPSLDPRDPSGVIHLHLHLRVPTLRAHPGAMTTAARCPPKPREVLRIGPDGRLNASRGR